MATNVNKYINSQIVKQIRIAAANRIFNYVGKYISIFQKLKFKNLIN